MANYIWRYIENVAINTGAHEDLLDGGSVYFGDEETGAQTITNNGTVTDHKNSYDYYTGKEGDNPEGIRSWIKLYNFNGYVSNSKGFYLKIYIGNTKIAETVRIKNNIENNEEQTYELEYVEEAALTKKGKIKIVVENNYSDTARTINFRSNASISIGIRYTGKVKTIEAPTNLDFVKNDDNNTAFEEGEVPGPEENVKLIWTAPSTVNTNNTISGYKIFRSTSASGQFEQLGQELTTETEYIIQTPSNKNDKYYYKVQTIGSVSNYINGGISSPIGPLICNYGTPDAPANFTINEKNTAIFITNNDSFQISWSNTDDPDNYNIIEGTVIEKANSEDGQFSEIKTIKISDSPNDSCLILDAPNPGASHYYRLFTKGVYENSSPTDSIKVVSISKPSSPIINHNSYNTITKSNVVLNWTAPSAITGAIYSYKIVCIKYINEKEEEEEILEEDYNQTSYIFNITDAEINENQSFFLKIATIAKSVDGSSLISDYAKTQTITRIPSFTIPNNFLLSCYDETNTDENGKQGIQPYGYNQINISWNDIEASDNNFSYVLKYRNSNNSIWTEATNRTSDTSALISIENESEGSTFDFKIEITDLYNVTKSIEYPNLFTKMTSPKLRNVRVGTTSYSTSNIIYDWDFTNNNTAELQCDIYLYYNNSYVLIETMNYDNSSNIETENIAFNYSLIDKSKTILTEDMLELLKNEVTNRKNCYPQGKIKIKLYSINFPNCYKEETIDFIYDYKTYIKVGELSFSKINNRSYYNPGDTIRISFTPASYTDAAGSPDGADITYKLTGNGGIWNQFNTEYEKIVLEDGNIIQKPKYYYIDDIAPNANDDLSIIYNLTAYATYADNSYVYDSTINTNDNNKINIARWNENDSVYLSSVQKEGTNVSGSLIISGNLCSSVTHENIQTITYSLINAETKETLTLEKSLLISYSNDLISVNFDFTYKDKGNLSIYAKVTFTNTSNKEIKKVTTAYLLRTAGVPLAIRKSRIGINVNSSSFINESDPLKNSALYIAADSDTASILELSASSNAKNPNFINFLKGDTNYGTIFFNEKDLLFHCDKWYYPVTKVNGQTGDIILTASDVEARPDTWIPATSDIVNAGTGISISGKTITWSPIAGTGINISENIINNTGVTAIASGSSNGTISVTTNGNTENVAVEGLGTMAYANTDTYLPKSGGTLTGTLIGKTINATVFGGDAIRYGDSTPSNPIVGQIWLKPKK